eukprot:TRINITY_DN43520_c0_g1_i1.p1 TRINITY_DN43520_c0_g1~~TRINITY_DN43520_c0_g1_i1.p1  ORF type:complete len:223 (-),score=43.06 TRINITY_DN43520_c0_g1_i1:294-962(-)
MAFAPSVVASGSAGLGNDEGLDSGIAVTRQTEVKAHPRVGARMTKLRGSMARLVEHMVTDLLREDFDKLFGSIGIPAATLAKLRTKLAADFSEGARRRQAEVLTEYRAEEHLALLDAESYGTALPFSPSGGAHGAEGADGVHLSEEDILRQVEARARGSEMDARLTMIRRHAEQQAQLNDRQAARNDEMRGELKVLLEGLQFHTAELIVAVGPCHSAESAAS